MISPNSRLAQVSVRRVLSRAAVLVALAVVMLAPSVAHAQEYPPTVVLLTDQAVVAEGGVVTLTGSGFLPNSSVEVYILAGGAPNPLNPRGTLLGVATSDSEGNFAFQWNTAGYAPKTYTLTATDGTNTTTTQVIVTAGGEQPVVPPVSPTTGQLPTTGGIGSGLAQAGIVLLTIGGLALLVSRRRSRSLSSAG